MSEHDNDTCPHLVRASLLKAENARLKADVNELAAGLKLASEVGIKIADEVTRLKAEVERLRPATFFTAVPSEDYEKLKAENERLSKAGDAMAITLQADFNGCPYHPVTIRKVINAWNAAKDGKPSA